MALGKRPIIRIGLEQRRQRAGMRLGVQRFFQRAGKRLIGKRAGRRARIERRADGHGKAVVFREDGLVILELQRLDKAAAQTLTVVQRAAEEEHLLFDRAPLNQAGDGLIDHGLIDAGRHVRFERALIEQRLYVGLGEHAAARGDGIDAIGDQAEPVHLGDGHIQQRRHLIDERAGAARAGAVHALVHAALEEDDLRVLAAQLDDRARVRLQRAHRLAGGVDLLHERYARRLGQTHARRAGNSRGEGFAAQQRLDFAHHVIGFLAHLREMALIFLIDDFFAVHQHQLGRGRADVDAQRERIIHGYLRNGGQAAIQ